MAKRKTGKAATFIFTLIFFAGISIMLYPIVSNWWNSKVQSKAVASYNETIEKIDTEALENMLEEAREYNRKLARVDEPFLFYDKVPGYNHILDVSGTGVMGYISIPVINVDFPIYHGTGEEVLSIAAGHFQGSSLPVGGKTTHSVISAHRGLPTAKLFTDLDKVVVGDTFTITILNEIFTYEVEDITIVTPDDLSNIRVVPGEDYVTLMTCTPYGVNTHRLLLRSKRIDTIYRSNAKVTSDAMQVDSMAVFPVVCLPLIMLLVLYWVMGGRSAKKTSVSKIKYELLFESF
ncbi:MAG: class C sortase [Ruminococcus sp.]|nr:class C sortase [Ruminococcus sp.]